MNGSVREGDGYFRYDNGERFWGQWKSNKKIGYGQLKKDGFIYSGEWKNGKMSGFAWIVP